MSPYTISVEQNHALSEQEKSEKIAAITLQLAQTAMKLARTYRVPRYDTESRESDSEHTVMVALHSAQIAAQFFPDLNPYEVAYKALIHELVETVTGDVQTFNISDDALHKKEQTEKMLLRRFVHNYQSSPLIWYGSTKTITIKHHVLWA